MLALLLLSGLGVATSAIQHRLRNAEPLRVADATWADLLCLVQPVRSDPTNRSGPGLRSTESGRGNFDPCHGYVRFVPGMLLLAVLVSLGGTLVQPPVANRQGAQSWASASE